MNWYKDKKFKCFYCTKSFQKKRQLKSHMQDGHPVELKLEQDKIVDEIIDDILTEEEDD